MAIIEITNLVKTFGNFTAVDNLSLSIDHGIFGLLGPNGAGKTTIIRMLCGLLKPTNGTVTISGYDVENDVDQIKKIVGYMPQSSAMYTYLKAGESLEFFANIYNIPKNEREKRIDRILELVDLKDRKNDLIGNYSGGMKQRIALAHALLPNPKVLLLDEPSAGVDPELRRQFWDYFEDLADNGTSILVTTHYMDEAVYCNKIGLMYGGKLVGLGSVEELRERVPEEHSERFEDVFVYLIHNREEVEQNGRHFS